MIDTTNYEFLTAHFSNNERTVATVYWGNKDETIEEIVKAEEKSPAWQRLLDHMDIDTLHEATYKHIRDQVEAYEDEVIRVAKEKGLIYDVDALNTEVYKMFAQVIFGAFNIKDDKEKLFALKLELFEIPQIRRSRNREMKAELRKAKNFVETVKIACEIFIENSQPSE